MATPLLTELMKSLEVDLKGTVLLLQPVTK